MLLTLDTIRLLGLDDFNKLSPVESDMFRLFVPVAKLYTAKQVSVTSLGSETGELYIARQPNM